MLIPLLHTTTIKSNLKKHTPHHHAHLSTQTNHQYLRVGNLKHSVGKNSCSSFYLHKSVSNV